MLSILKHADGSWYVFLLALMIGGWVFFTGTDSSADAPGESYVVSEGDTLWSIAEEVTEEVDIPVEKTVYWLKQENDLHDRWIQPGQKLKVPAYENGVND
ncbi:cell division suppressor protein YneA [Alkalicoccus urumqiensis]|uniref:LysM domain-containing protein n=1 Tax=Alkalicoccus urumqiensis TaxID=1548213 RepID=A0A2P6MDW1_ALKUR|nr:LysM peptidoglycan-binding domain-containing protein [Alkalicoccus urumqiensis]PRO64467.1 hypothetical protein C6I21_14825 [Alkalicoccus urumqiensis]